MSRLKCKKNEKLQKKTITFLYNQRNKVGSTPIEEDQQDRTVMAYNISSLLFVDHEHKIQR